jgi:hypothetical protein
MLPTDIIEIIWDYYWKDIFSNSILSEFKTNLNNDKILNEYITNPNNSLLLVSHLKINKYLEMNTLLDKCLKNKSFTLQTQSSFFKLIKTNSYKMYDIFPDDIKLLVQFTVFYSNYMSMNVFYQFKKNFID